MYDDSLFDISICDGFTIDILLLYHKINISFFISFLCALITFSYINQVLSAKNRYTD